MNTIVLRELYTQIVSSRFIIIVSISFLLVAFTSIVSINDYQVKVANYNTLSLQYERELNENRVYSSIAPKSIRPPYLLSIFTGGYLDKMPFVFETNTRMPIKPSLGFNSENALFNTILKMDILDVFLLYFSLIAILLGYDLVCGEHRSGTLKLVLTTGISKKTFLTGKIVAHFLVLLLMLIFNGLFAITLVVVFLSINITSTNLILIALLGFVSAIYLLVFYLLGVLFSIITNNQLTSLLSSLFIWIFLLFVYPYFTQISVAVFKPIPESEYLNIERETTRLQEPIRKYHVNMAGYFDVDYIRGVYRIQSLNPSACYTFSEFVQKSEPERIGITEKIEQLHEFIFQLEYQQLKMLHILQIFNPSAVYRETCESICGVSVEHFVHFRELTKQYKTDIQKYFISNNVYKSLRYFTILSQEELENYKELVVPKWQKIFSDHRKYGVPLPSDDMNYAEPIELSDFPRFKYIPLSVNDRIDLILASTIWLMILNIGLVVVSFHLFSRKEIV